MTSIHAKDVLESEDGPNPERPAESRTEPHGATAILRLIAHGRGCECDLCTNQPAETDRSQP